ncbi:MAG: FmdE family protein [Anaerolineae bacterium]|nr:FmdE family protein [Anaerolineae bacterium]
MLTREAIFRQIHADRVEPIQQLVAVDYDNTLQAPISFHYGGRDYEVTEVIGRFRASTHDPSVLYLVRAHQEVYALYRDLTRPASPFIWHGQWVLHFRVDVDQEQGDDMLVDMKLKRVADFHGHLCPDLVIGYRAAQAALPRLTLERMYWQNLRVIVENTTSAVDAVQILTGCTLGNRKLWLRDWGKHVYTFVYGQDEGLRLSLQERAMPENTHLLMLEEKIQKEQASMRETAQYQVLLDEYIAALLTTPDEVLFAFQRVAVTWPIEPCTSARALCACCGEPVLKTHLVQQEGKYVCRACSEKPYVSACEA